MGKLGFAVALGATVLSGCTTISLSFEGLACDAGTCIDGYECNPVTDQCVRQLLRGCGGNGVCWSDVGETDPCGVAGSWIPCSAATDCTAGCRTCEAGTWGSCVGTSVCDGGPDADGDGICDGDDTCTDVDKDGIGIGIPSNDGCIIPNVDTNDGLATACVDFDGDTCDDCFSGSFDPDGDGVDTDGDGECDAGDDDDDGDTILDGNDTNPLDPFRCQDTDGDTCDDCIVTGGPPDPANDGVDADMNGICDIGNPCIDTDLDGLGDGTAGNVGCNNTTTDQFPADGMRCADTDSDGCDDCSSGVFNPANDGNDFDGDGACDSGDTDSDNDGIDNGSDPFPLDADRCGDTEPDGCDDCAVGTDGIGPLSDSLPATDGTDADGDGWCAMTDCNDNLVGGGSINPGATEGPTGDPTCMDMDDNDCDMATDAADDGCNWYDVNWDYRKAITILSAQVTGSHTNFPVLIDITDSDLQMFATGPEILFTAADGVTKIPHEKEFYGSGTGRLVAWVNTPLVTSSSDQFIYVYFGHAAPTEQQDRNNTWGSDYMGVWHFGTINGTDFCGQDVCDSTSGVNHGSRMVDMPNGTLPAGAVGKIGDGVQFFGETSNDGGWLEVPDDNDLDFTGNQATLSAWVQKTQDQVDDIGVLIKSNNSYQAHLGIQNNERANARYRSGSTTRSVESSGTLSNSQWYYIVARYSGSNVTIWVDGASVGSGSLSGNVNNTGEPVAFGRRAPGTSDQRFFIGIIDEGRMSDIARPNEWITTEYANQDDPASFVRVEMLELRP